MANIEQTKQLNKLLEAQAKIVASQEESLKNQLNITQQLVTAMQGLSISGMATDAADLNRAIDEAARSVDNLGQGQHTTEQIRKSLEEAVNQSDEFGNSLSGLGKKFLKLAPVVGTIEGIVAGFRLLRGVMTSALSISTSLIGSMLSLSAAILTAPFKLLEGLMGMAARGGAAELRRQIEELRGQFGDLAENESRAVMDAWRSVDHFGGQLAETGLLVWRTLGNMAESMEKLREMAVQLGPAFTNLRDQFRENAERIFAYREGLGFSEDAMAGLGRMSQSLGIEMQEVGRQVTQMAFGMGKAFGINGKLIGRDIGEMINDFANFGNLAVKELSSIAVFARKLGVEIKELLGVIDKFDNFEDAATSVAQLSQAFGVHLDTLELVKAQDPAQRIEALRKSFFAAGQSIENMTRQERALLAQQTGLEQNTLRMVFSQKNQALSYEEMQKQSKATEKQQLSQAEAMKELADSIKRIVRQGGQMENSFFKIFVNGFKRGVRWTREWWGLMWRLRRAMRITRWTGMRVGQDFVKYFPGVKDFLGGLRDIFDLRRWRRMSRGIKIIFRDFFKAIAGDDPHAVPNLLERLKENFFNWFDTTKGPGKRVLKGLENFTKAFVKIAGHMLGEAMKALGKALRGLSDFIKNPDAVLGQAGAAGEGILGWIVNVLRPAFESIKEAWPILRDGFMELMETAWDKIKPMITGFLEEHWPKILAVLFGPAIIGGAIRGLTFGLAGMLLSGLKGGLGMFSKSGGGIISQAFGKLGMAAPMGAVAAGGVNAQTSARTAAGMSGAIQQIDKTRVSGRMVGNLVLLGTIISVGLVAVTIGLVKLAEYIQESNLDTASIIKAGLVMTTAGVVMMELAGVIRILSAATAGLKTGTLIAGVTAVTAVGAALSFGMRGLIDLFQDVNTNEIMVTLGVMSAASVIALELSAITLALAGVGALSQSLAAQIAIGLGAIAIVGGAMALGAIGLLEAFKGYGPAEIERTSAIMAATSKFFLSAIAVTVGAGVIGAIVTATGGLAAAAVAAGLATLTGVMLSMVVSIREIIDKITSIRVGLHEFRALKAFVFVLEAMGKFANNLTSMIKAVSPGIIDTIFSSDNMSSRLSNLSGMIETFASQMRSTVHILVSQAQELAGSGKRTLESAKLLADLLNSIAAAATSIRPPDEVLEGDWLPWGNNAVEKMAELRKYITAVMNALQDTMVSVVEKFTVLAKHSGFTKESLRAAQAISEIIKSVGQLGRMMTVFVSREYATTDPETLKKLAPQLGNIIDAIMSAVIGPDGQNVFTRISGVFNSVIGTIKELDASQLRAIKTASPVIEASFMAMSSIAALVGNIGLGKGITADPEKSKKNIDQIVRVVNSITYGLGNNIKKIIETLVAQFGNLDKGGLQSVAQGIEVLPTLFESIDKMMSTITRFGESKRVSGQSTMLKTIGKGLYDFTTFLAGSAPGGHSTVMDFLKYINKNAEPLNKITTDSANVLPQIVKSIEQIEDITTSLAKFNESISETVNVIHDTGIERIKTGVTAMIDNIQDFGIALQGIGTKGININRELKRLNTKLGLESHGEFAVRHHPVTLNVNFTVKIDADELETTLIDRPGGTKFTVAD